MEKEKEKCNVISRQEEEEDGRISSFGKEDESNQAMRCFESLKKKKRMEGKREDVLFCFEIKMSFSGYS